MGRPHALIYRTVNGVNERSCHACGRWWPLVRDNWYLHHTGIYKGQLAWPKCRHCYNPSGRGPGRPPGSGDKQPRKQREARGGQKSHQSQNAEAVQLDPNALLNAAARYGIDPAAIAARMAEE